MAMKEVGIDWKVRRLIEGLYPSQTSMIKFYGDFKAAVGLNKNYINQWPL